MAGVTLLLLPFLSGLIGAAVLYVVALPVVRWLDPARRHKGVALGVVLMLFVVIVLPGGWLLAELLGQAPDAARSLQESAAVQRLMVLQVGDFDVGSYLRQASSAIIGWSSRQTMVAVTGLLNATLNLAIALFGAYYLLVGAEALWERTKAQLPFCPTTAEFLRLRFHRVTEAMLLGVVLTCAAQGALVAAAFAALRLPHPLLWGAVTAVVAILPIFGSAIVWFPGVLVLFAQQRPVAALALATLGALVISNIDNALRLVVYRRVSQIHPMVTLVGAFAGVRAFGLAGLLLGPLVFSYAIELLRIQRPADGALTGDAAALEAA